MSTPRSLVLADGVRRTTLTTERGDFAALQADPGTPATSTILLIPGWTGSKEDFLAILAPLAGHRKVVAIDQRGQNDSEGKGPYDIDVFARDAVSLAEPLGPAGTVHLVGHSFGGHVARAAVIREPERFASLTLMSSGSAGLKATPTQLLRLMAKGLETMTLEQVYAYKRASERERGLPEPPPEIEAFLHRRFCANDPASLLAITRYLVDPPDRTDELTGLAIPILVLYGDNDDGWEVADQASVAQRLGAAHEVIPDAGHSPAVDQPEATAQALNAFLDRTATQNAPSPQNPGISAP